MTAERDNGMISVRDMGSTRVVVLSGTVDLHHTPQIHRALVDACDDQPPRLVVNLERVAYIDSSGIGTLVEVYRRVKAYDGQLVLCGLSERVRGVFEITKLDKFFTIHKSEAEALTA